MGMAASQARLLMLTARLHDVEFSAQRIQNAKLQLATQQDDVYEDYQRALDATSLTFATMDATGVRSDVIANFNNLFSMNAATPATEAYYGLIDSRGRLVVSDDIERLYNNFIDTNYTQNAYTFAMYALYGDNFESNAQSDLLQAIIAMVNENLPNDENEGDSELLELLQNISPNATQMTTRLLAGILTASDGDDQNQFLNYFFNHYGMRALNDANMSTQDMQQFNYYVRMFGAIEAQGGCISIEDFNGPSGTAATNSEWLTAMIQSGQMSISLINTDEFGNISLTATSPSSDQNLAYTTTSRIDRAALARAEAEYEHALKVIDRKDKKYDLELNKLETERSALTKQYDSIKKVIDDNIERTFGIFS